MAASRQPSKAATLPPRVAPPRPKRQTEPPSTTQSFLGRIKCKFRFKNKDSGYDFGEPINVQGVYFRRKSGEFSNSKDGEVQMAGNYSGRIEVSRSMSERYASKPVSKLSKFKIGMRGNKSAKNSNIVLESELDGNISPRMSLSLGNEERVICQNDYLTSENSMIDLDSDYKLTNTAVLDDVDPGYETLDEVREKLRNLKKSKPETVSGVSNRAHRETNSSRLSHKRSLSSGTPRRVFEGLSTFSSGSETGLSMPAEAYHYDHDTSSSPVLYRQNLKDFNESEVSTSPVIPSHRRCHSERFQLPPDATLTTRTGSCPIEVQDPYYPCIGFYGDENKDISLNKAGSDTLWKETVDIYANPNIVSKKSSGVYSDDRRSSYQEPEIENEDSTPPIPDRKYSMEGIVDLMGGDLEPDSPEEQDVHICSVNTSETEVPYNVHFSDRSFHPTSHVESKRSMPLQMFESENLHRDYLYESIDECKRKMKVTSTENDEEDDDYDDAWDNEDSVAAKLVKSAVCELNSPSVLYESVDDCRKKESDQYAFSQNRFADQLSNQNQDAFIRLEMPVTEEGHSKNLSPSIALVDVSSSSMESKEVCTKEKSSDLNCNDSKNVEERPKNIWKFKREHLYAEIDDLQNEDQIRQNRQIRNRIELKEVVHFENTDKDKSLLNGDITEPSQTGRCISKGLTHNPELEYLEDVTKCECSTSYMTQNQRVDCESVNHRNTSVSVSSRSGEEPFLSNSSSEVKLKSNEFKDSCFSNIDTLEDFHELKRSVERLNFDHEGEVNYQCEANSLGHERTTFDTHDDRKSCDNFSSTSDIDASECSKSSYSYNYSVSHAFPVEYDVSSPGNVNLRSSLSPGELHISTEDNAVINPPMLTPTSSSTIYYGGMTASLELPKGEEIVSTDVEQASSSVPTDAIDTNIRHLVKLKPMSAFINQSLIDEFGMFDHDRDFETSMGSSNTDDSLDTACSQRDTSISYEETADSVLENLSFHNDAMSEGFSSTENLLDYDSSKEAPAQNSFEAETTEKSAHKSKIVTNHLDASTKEVPESSDITMTSDCLKSVNFEDTDVKNNKKIEESSVAYSQNIDGAVADVSQKRLPNYFYDDDEPIHMSISDLYPSKYQETNAASSVSVNKGILRNKSGRSSPMKKSTSCVIGNSGPSSNVTEQRRNVRSTIDERPPAIIPRKMQQESECRKDFWDSMRQLKDCGWYWGPMSWDEAEMKLANKPDGSFLVRDSSNDRYLLSLSFNTNGHVHHTRIEHHKGKFSFWSQPDSLRKATIQEFIEKCIRNSQNGQFLYFIRPAGPGAPPIAVHLLYPVSRFKQMQSLQHICRFNIVQRVRRDHIDQLPIPKRIKDYLKESQYYVEYLED